MFEAPDDKIKDRGFEVLGLVGLEQKCWRFSDELSGGEQQRVCVARLIVYNGVVLMLDEPTGNLDPQTSDEIVDIFERM